jgi:hypothetical protein
MVVYTSPAKLCLCVYLGRVCASAEVGDSGHRRGQSALKPAGKQHLLRHRPTFDAPERGNGSWVQGWDWGEINAALVHTMSHTHLLVYTSQSHTNEYRCVRYMSRCFTRKIAIPLQHKHLFLRCIYKWRDARAAALMRCWSDSEMAACRRTCAHKLGEVDPTRAAVERTDRGSSPTTPAVLPVAKAALERPSGASSV